MHSNNTYNKRTQSEQRIGMTLPLYFKDAIKRRLTQQEMAGELGVSRITVMRWLASEGYEAITTYTKRRAA